jgi:heme oxygenase
MYQGMLIGGRSIRVWCQRAFGQKTVDGTRAFQFEATIPDPAAFRVRYIEALNSLSLSREERDAIIEQKCRILDMNGTLFAELRQSKPYRSQVMTIVLATLFALAVCWVIFTHAKSMLASSS